MRLTCLAVLLALGLLAVSGCARHTYYVELTNGNSFYVDPPLVLDKQSGTYHMKVNGLRKVISIDEVRYIDDAAPDLLPERVYRHLYLLRRALPV